MASITFTNPNFNTLTVKRPSYPSSHNLQKTINSSTLSLCRCLNNGNSSSSSSSSQPQRWDAPLRNALDSAIQRFDSFVNSRQEVTITEDDDDDEWDWERWKKHFDDVDERERNVNILKLQLDSSVRREDYKEAAMLKVAIAAAAANDTVGREIFHLNRAVEEERYEDAVSIRDHASAGLLGWWAGVATDSDHPYGQIIRITAEHGRYMARAFNPRQLTTDASGPPLFEIFLTVNKKGEYKQQAVYLKRGDPTELGEDSRKVPSKASQLNQLDLTEEKSGLLIATNENSDSAIVVDDGDGLDEGLSEFQNILSDMIPGFRVKVLKVTTSGKVDRDQISKVIKQILEEEDEVDNLELKIGDQNIDETDQETDDFELDASDGLFESDKPQEITVEVVIDSLPPKPSSSSPANNLIRVPAKLERNGNMSFSFSVKQDDKLQVVDSKEKASVNRNDKLKGKHAIEGLVFNVAKSVNRDRISLKTLKDIGDMIEITLNQAQKQERLSGSTTFNRLKMATSTDPLNGLYIGAHGLYTSEVIQLSCRYGQWQEDGLSKESSNLEFYEYVEALKLTGDPSIPAGEVMFRAKIGKRYQLPHKGVIPEELGVIARYKGQGKLTEAGFQKPRWIDGELVILDGKFIKGGPVVGFLYWVPESHFMRLFTPLNLPQ